MAYEKQSWNNNDLSTPINAARLNHIEDGIAASSDAAVLRPSVQKSVSDGFSSEDAFSASSWSSNTDFVIPVEPTTEITTGSEFEVLSTGAGVGRVRAREENLFPYPDASVGFSGGIWQARGAATVSVAAGIAPGGRDAIRVTATGASSAGGFGHTGGTALFAQTLDSQGLKAGDVISARAWLAPPEGQNGRIQVRFYRGSATLSEPSTSNTPGTGLRYVNGITVPVGATSLAILSYSTAPASGATMDIADPRVALGSGPIGSFIDGNSPGGVWWGVPGQSPSSIGRVLGDVNVPANGRAVVRYEGSGVWRVSPVGSAVGVLRRTDTLAVDRDNGQQGMFAPSSPFSTSDTAVVSGRTYVTRFVPSRTMGVQSIGFRLTTVSATDDPCSVGIYNSAGTQVATSGAVNGLLNGSAGMKFASIPLTILDPGAVYYAAFSAASTAAVRRGTVLADAFGTTLPAVESGFLTAHPVPSSLSTVTVADAAVLFVLREFS